ncbi:hypothetical protein ACFSC6_19205 [Rufibacter sediminis]|uniref:STAS/SEC14 domain-containing protein n=1 Tax=Rufibacter sediminis TaxID=2762756 RepID=A0ABR6VR69_9BACT|nr:hypothetical protein [Rufibacter sediminis]MBC3539652.1 hypothetical protein [Rufibacter sediminis]
MVEREILEGNLHLTYRKDLDILFLRWFRVPDSAQLRQGYLQALELAKEMKSAYWMFDLRSRGQVSPEDETWLLQTFFPRVEEELGYQGYFANLVTPSHYAYIRDVVGLEYLEKYGKIIKLGIYTSEQDAVAWLLESRANR